MGPASGLLALQNQPKKCPGFSRMHLRLSTRCILPICSAHLSCLAQPIHHPGPSSKACAVVEPTSSLPGPCLQITPFQQKCQSLHSCWGPKQHSIASPQQIHWQPSHHRALTSSRVLFSSAHNVGVPSWNVSWLFSTCAISPSWVFAARGLCSSHLMKSSFLHVLAWSSWLAALTMVAWPTP